MGFFGDFRNNSLSTGRNNLFDLNYFIEKARQVSQAVFADGAEIHPERNHFPLAGWKPVLRTLPVTGVKNREEIRMFHAGLRFDVRPFR
jgi:hypothetical protein